ncbi:MULTISPECIES: transposase [unclassified Bacillus (in: firmicutes)]|uniref:transposase n=1 Tax=unclassified Bacillus (in: firmicutes) TaxID=185979 RepID=UPI0008E98933|nr:MULTISPECIES: transposase [unclassified Bacillus (in: firmicutes)]SFB20093.1 REP element-mobilizing transposase RayT [Bacillus sp. UNCCL13]SFQ90816.1 REP element-mobilizing transposase RayT [Bacillus sp. cl95]
MGREKRVWMHDRFYHVVCRGNRRDPLFRSPSDFKVFYHILNQLHEKFPLEIASYCLMTNHFHLQLRSEETSLSKVMSLMNKRYANYYNTKYHLTGHVFEKRYFAKIIDNYMGMIEVSRYIHLNPVEAGMVKRPENYPWSSYKFYCYPNHFQPGYLNTAEVLKLFEGTVEEKRIAYCACHAPKIVEFSPV